MSIYLLLFCVSISPATAAILVTLPFWHSRYTKNEDIQSMGVLVLIAGMMLILAYSAHVTIAAEDWLRAFLCIPFSAINILLFGLYNRHLHLTRCPYCRKQTLKLISHTNGRYKLCCRHCGNFTQWKG